MSELKGSFDGFVGIDVSKDKFDACGITRDEAKLFQFSATVGGGEEEPKAAVLSPCDL